MAIYHGRIKKGRKKRKHSIGREPALTSIGKERRKIIRTKGGGKKVKLISSESANVIINNKWTKCKILQLVENPASRDFTRRNIIDQ